MSGDAKSIGEELVASVRQLARDVSSLAEEARLAREGDSRQAEQIARARRASADENGDLMEAIDDVPGKILRAVRAGALAGLQMPSPTEPGEAPPRTESGRSPPRMRCGPTQDRNAVTAARGDASPATNRL